MVLLYIDIYIVPHTAYVMNSLQLLITFLVIECSWFGATSVRWESCM